MEMTIAEKVSYIKGLAEGMKLDTESNEGKILAAIIDVLGDIAINIEEIDEDLGFVEDIVYDDEEDDDDDDDDYDDDDDDFECDLDCEHCCHPEDCEDDEDDDDDDDEEGFRCLMCPSCNEKIYFDESIDPADLICPACGKAVCEEEPEGADDVK